MGACQQDLRRLTCAEFLNTTAPDTESSAASGPQAGGGDKRLLKQVKIMLLDKTFWRECHETFQKRSFHEEMHAYLMTIMSFPAFLNYFDDN